MNCQVCGSEMLAVTTDLPFKLSDSATIIIKQVPVLQCSNCREYLMEDEVMAAVDRVIAGSDHRAEVEIVQYAA